jgi:integrase
MPKTRKVGKYLELKGNTWMVFMDVPKDLRKHFGKARLKKSLQTSDAGLAEQWKHQYIADWKMQIAIARNDPNMEIGEVSDAINAMNKYLDEMNLSPQMRHLMAAKYFNPNVPNLSEEQQSKRTRAFGGVTATLTNTADYLDEFFEYAKYAPEVHIEGKRYMTDVFVKKFPVFETISTEQLVAYCDARLRGTDGKQVWSRVTLRKNLNFAKKYWEYCAQRYTSAPNLIDYERILPQEIRTKATRKSSDEANKAYSVDEVYLLLDAAVKKAEETNRHGDHNLVDLIRLGMYTGCRIEELCQMKLTDVTADSFIIRDSKTESGQRLVPMHKEVTQVVERLKQSSTDGYLLSGESTANATGKRSKGLSQRFSRHKQDLGFGNKVYTFHSFRSTLAKRFESAGVEEIRAARIIGHKVKSMTYGIYSRGTDWDVLFNTMNEKISFPRSA